MSNSSVLEMVVQCACGLQEVVGAELATTLRKCRRCGQVNRMPGIEAFYRFMEDMRKSHMAFVDEEIVPDLPVETLRKQSQRMRYALVKKHICGNCFNNYDGFYTGEIPGYCPQCTDNIAKRFEARAPREDDTETVTRVRVPHPMDDPEVAMWTWILVGLTVGFALGGLAAFSTPYI